MYTMDEIIQKPGVRYSTDENGQVTGITEMYQRKNAHSYSQQPRTGRLIPPNYRHRRKRSKDHRYRREIELEEDIVKTGSEDETEVRYKRRLRRRRDERGKRNEVTYTALNRDKQFWKSQLARERNDFLMKNRNDSVGPLRVERNTGTKSQSSVSNTPKVTYNGPMPHLSDGYGAVPIRNPGRQDSVSTNRNMEAEFGVVPNIVKTPAYGKQRTRTIVSDNHSHLMVQNGPHETYKVDNSDHKNARSKRASVLNRAEKLLHVRKLREETSSGEEGDTEKSDEPLAQRKVEYPSSDDDKYVVVKTTVSPTDSDLYTDLDVPLPPLPRNDVYPSRNSGKSIPSMTRSEIPMYSDDEYDAFPPQRPYTDTYRDYPPFVMGRYEQSKVNGNPPTFDVQAKVNKPGNRRGKRVTFFRNGDKDFRGYPVCINPLQFLNFEALLVYLNDKITTPSGVRYIFSLPDGKEMKSVTDFQQGRSYVVSSVKKPNVELEYGQSREVFWSNRKPSAGRVRKDEIELFKHPSSPSNVAKSKHRVITIKNNEFRHISEKFYVNPNTKQNFEDMLVTMGDMTNVDIHALYTERAPHRKVESFSQLFNEFRNHDNFITCGPEMVPIELDSSKRPAPSSNSSSESMIGATRKKKFQDHYDAGMMNYYWDLDERLENHDSPSPVQNTYDEAEHDTQQKVMTSRKDRDDCVKFDLRGKLRDYYAPSVTYTNDDGARPNKKLKLEWIYGYAAKETGRNLFVYPTGELLYNVAAVAVFYNHRAKTQRHYLGHTEEISCLALHPNEYWIASGQYAGKESPAHIRIWDGKQLTTFHVIGIGFFNVGVASIGFSEETSGQYLCAVDAGDKHVLSIWEWEKENNGRLVAKTTTTHKTVVCACFYKLNDNLLITYGTEHLYFWSLFPDPMNQKEGKLYRDKHSGNFEDDGVHKQITAHAFSSNGDVITGDSNGSIIVWSRNADYVFKINKEITTNMFGRPKKPELQKAVSALFVMGDNSLLSGGGSTIASWDCNNGYKQISQRDIPEVAGNVRTIIPQRGGGTDGKIYIGTANGCVLGCSISTMFDFIIQGHFDEVWSIATFPEEQSFITAGHDQLVIKWSASSPKSFWRSQVENPCSAVALDPDGQYVAVGSTAGRFFVLNARNGMHVITVQVGKAQINTMSFSRDGAMLAVGCHDGHIHIFYVHDDGKIYRKNNIILRGHAKFVINLDWSFDGRFLQSVDSDFDLLFWNIQRMEREDPRKLKDCNWNTSTCCAGYSTMGPWTTCENGENVSVICRSNYREIIATGDNRGRIKLFKYPCSTHMPACRWTKLYSSTTTALNFIHDDTYVISSAGKPPVLARWAVMDTYTSK